MKTVYLKLNLQLFSQEKTEKATPKKRRNSRKKGQIAKSQELPASIMFICVFASFLMFGDYYARAFDPLFRGFFESKLLIEPTIENLSQLSIDIIVDMVLMLAPIFIIVILVGLIGNVIQFGFLLTTEPIKPKLDKLNPISGFKKMFSMRSLVELVKSVLKLAIIGSVVFTQISNELDIITSLALIPLSQTFAYTVSLVVKLGIIVGALLIIMAVFDFLYQKYEFEKSIRMSKQDIIDEHKKSDGDPKIKAKRKERQMRMAFSRMMKQVPNADVVITNPTHFAVALKYDVSKMDAPTVIAKGTDLVALKIREIAKENGVVIMENKLLARALYKQTEIGQTIPADLFQAVAEVLAHVYKLKGKINTPRRASRK